MIRVISLELTAFQSDASIITSRLGVGGVG
jgi:hypothetical protein